MSEHPFQSWVDKTAKYSGVMASGVRLANRSTVVKTFDESFPEARLADVLQSLTEISFTLRNSQLGGARLCWVFEHGQLHSARRLDGATAILAVNKDPGAAAAIEELFAEFLATGATTPEVPGIPSESGGVQ
jgi:hypothetical protein